MPVTQLSLFRGRVVLQFQTTSGENFPLRWAHIDEHVYVCLGVGFFIYLSVCFGNGITPSVLLAFSFIGLSLFHFTFEERARLLQPLRGLSLSGITLRLHDLCTFRNGWTTGWTYIPSFTFVKKSKLKRCLDFVLPSVYVIACSKLDDYVISCCLGRGLGR